MIRWLRRLAWRWREHKVASVAEYPRLPAPVYLRLTEETEIPTIAERPRRVVIVSEMTTTPEWMNSVVEWILEAGCLYAVAWGIDCEAWHDAIDWANLERFDFEDIPDEHFIMTTWHADEGLADALWFARECAYHDDVDLEEVIILHIAAHDRGPQIVSLYETVDVAREKNPSG